MVAQEKAAGVLDTPSTASQTNHTAILGTREANRKDFDTLRARLALLGRELTRCHRAHDGRVLYVVVRWGKSQYFNRLQDVSEHLAEIGRRP